MSEDRTVPDDLESLSLEDALDVLAEGTRARILVELGEAWGEGAAGPAVLSYSELMDRVGVRDSGRFNYHLNAMVGTFVRKLEAGYVLHHPGHLVYRSIVAGVLTDRPSGEPIPVGDCPECGGDAAARYLTDHVLSIRCGDCGTTMDRITAPPRLAESHSGTDLVEAAVQKQFHDLSLHRRGICYGCGGTVDRRVETDPIDWTPPFDTAAYCLLACAACHEQLITEPAHVALTTPPVAAFLTDHGYDPATTRSWDDVLATAKDEARVVSTEPLELHVPFDLGEERLDVYLDDDLGVRRSTVVPDGADRNSQ